MPWGGNDEEIAVADPVPAPASAGWGTDDEVISNSSPPSHSSSASWGNDDPEITPPPHAGLLDLFGYKVAVGGISAVQGLLRGLSAIASDDQKRKVTDDTANALEEYKKKRLPEYYGVAPEDEKSTTGKVAGAAASVFDMAPGPAMMISKLAGQTYSNGYDRSVAAQKEKGETDEKTIAEQARKDAALSVAEQAPVLAAYALGGKIAGAVAGKLAPAAGPLARGLLGGTAATGANLTVSGAARAVQGEPVIGDLEQNLTDAFFGATGGLHEAFSGGKRPTPASAKTPAVEQSPTGDLKSFDQLPDDLVPASSAIINPPSSQPFLQDPGIPFMTKVRLKEQAKEFGLTDEQIAPMTGVEISQLAESRRAEGGDPAPAGKLQSEEGAAGTQGDATANRVEENVPTAATPSENPRPSAVKKSPEEIAAEEEYHRSLQEDARAAQAENGAELLDAIADAGGLPAKNAASREAFAGEIKRVEEFARDPERNAKIPLNKLFRNDAPAIDELATRLRDRGFDVQTPGELLDLVENRIRSGREIYGTPAAVGAGAYASLAKGTLPRRIQSPALASPAAPRSLADIRKYLSSALDIPIRLGTRVAGGMKGAFGLYRVKPQTIRMKALNDIPTIAHEIGHDLHHIVFTDPATGGPSNFLWGFDGELKPLGRRTSPPNAPSELVRMEGVAEFAREYLTDRAAAIAKAPQFTAYFETTLKAQHPEIFQILTKARNDLQAYIAAPGWEKAKGMIQWDEPDVRKPWRDRLEKFYTNWFNELRPIDRAMTKLTELGLDPLVARQVSSLAINYRGGWRGKADHDLRFELTDLHGNRRGKSLHEIVGGIADRQDFETYITLKRAQEKANQGKTTGFEDALADPDTHQKLRDLAPIYETRRQELIKYSEGLLANMEQSGYFTADQLTAMRSANRDYVPFYRIYEAVTGATSGPRGGGDGMVNTSAGVMKFKGSDLQIASPLESIIKNTYMFRDLAERNRIGRAFVDAVEATTGGGRVAESLLKPMKPASVTHAEMVAKLKDVGLGVEADNLTKAGVDLGMTIFRAADGVSAKDGTFSIWQDGKQKLYQVGDEALLRSLTLADSTDATLISKMPFFKPAAWITGKLRTGATLSAEFIARNLTRDQITAAIFSRNGFVPLFDSARGIFSVFKQDRWYQDWLKSGASHSGLFDSSAKNVEQALREMIKEPTALGTALELIDPRNIIKNLTKASSMIEESTRVAEFRRAVGAGKSPLEAANDAKDVTLNFSRHGAKGKVVNQLIAFFNAGLQDLDKIARAHIEAPVRTATKAFMYITAPSILAWYLGKDDERIQALPEWRKAYFWNLNLGNPGDADAFVLSVPKPFLLGSIYGTGAEKALDYINGKDPNAIWKFGASLMQSAVPGGGLTVLPTAFKPVIENITNYSFFTGRPLVNESQKQLEPALQFNPQTSDAAKLVGPKIGVSPIMVDNLVRGYLGGLGMTGLDAVDWFMTKTGLASPGTAPAKSWRELPGIRAFFGSPYAPDEYLGRFYKAMDLAEGRLKTFDAYGNRMMTGEQSRYWEANRNALVWYKAQAGDGEVITQLRRLRDQMSDLGKSMVMIQNDRYLDGSTKRERLINLKTARDKLARIAFDTYVHPDDRKTVF